jgi:coenzyme F420-0:L-glutamate ligase/coenzyme F420-1:gamma-L-glutamate ligase
MHSSLREVRIIGVKLPEIKFGDDIGYLIVDACIKQGVKLEDRDIIVVTHKIVSKAEGYVYRISDITPSIFAERISLELGKDPRHVELILRQARRIVKMRGPHIITETIHGFVCANSAVDLSNVSGGDTAVTLPEDPDSSAMKIGLRIKELTGVDVAVIISDTFGRAWRRGLTDVAIGVWNIKPLLDYRGIKDPYGYELRATVVAVADEVASAAELVMGKTEGIPVAIVKGVRYEAGEGSYRDLIRPLEEDLFR